MNPPAALSRITDHLKAGGHLLLFLDYDGTLVPIAPTPAEARPDPALLDLLTQLACSLPIQTIILSGRPLESLQAMLPIHGLTLAGLYGLEVWRDGTLINRGLPADKCRPTITWVSSQWSQLIQGRNGFLIEDKGCAVALHGRWADPIEAKTVFISAETIAMEALQFSRQFRVLGGQRFLEVAPLAADKAQSVEWLLGNPLGPQLLPVYFGDDDKDERAFNVVSQIGGLAVGVGQRYELAQATVKVDTPQDVRDWLTTIVTEARQSQPGNS